MPTIRFEIQAVCPVTGARAGLLHTAHGTVETPVFMPVGTQAAVKGLTPRHLIEELDAKIILANTYHLFLRPGHEVIRKLGGLHRFMQWPRAIAISEASWTQIGHLTSYVTAIYGSEGTLLVEPGAQGRVLLATRAHEDGVPVDVPPAPEEMRNATAFFLSHIVQGKPIKGLCSAEVGRDAQEILEAGLISAAEGTAVSLPLPPSYL